MNRSGTSKALCHAIIVAHVLTGSGAYTDSASQAFDEANALGRASNPQVLGNIRPSNAATVVPHYNENPREVSYYGSSSLSGSAQTTIAACRGAAATDPICAAIVQTQSTAPRSTISPYDSLFAPSRTATNDPLSVIGSLSSQYSNCKPATVAGATANKLCKRYPGGGNFSCSKRLTVDVTIKESCIAGTWFAQAQADRNGTDHVYAQAYCDPTRSDGKQRFRFYAHGSRGACIDWQSVDLATTLSTAPQLVSALSPHWDGACRQPFDVVMGVGSGCHGNDCHYDFQFGNPVYGCPSGQIEADRLFDAQRGTALGSAMQCFAAAARTAGHCGSNEVMAFDVGAKPLCVKFVGAAGVQGASGWTLNLAFGKPTLRHDEADQWIDSCEAAAHLGSAGQCTLSSAPTCVDGPSTKRIGGVDVTRECWEKRTNYSCAAGASLDECAPLRAQGCTRNASSCLRSDPLNPAKCSVYQDTYYCPGLSSGPVASLDCADPNRFCLGTSCFNIQSQKDPDFAAAVTHLEAAREAGVYLDPNTMQVFHGTDNQCRSRIIYGLSSCCKADAAGSTMNNRGIFGSGSLYVYDILFNSDNRAFVMQGLTALVIGAGFSGSFTAYGVTLAVNGAAIPAGSVAVASAGNVVIAVDPWTLVIAVIIYVVLSAMECKDDENVLSMKKGANLCRYIGDYCSSRSIFGCRTRKQSYCCFNSRLVRLIQEQGRPQLGIGWGSAREPQCGGFSIAQLQRLDFSKMDLSEFYASIVPTLPSLTSLTGNASERVPKCYQGQGQCQ
jgi:conjugal transfer mating pair stabilization protein TraN